MPASVTWKGPTTQLVEATNSPSYKVSDRIIQTRAYHCLFSYGESQLGNFAKGTAGTGGQAGYTVGDSALTKQRGNIGLLTVNWEASSASSGQPLPGDEVNVSATNQSPRTERHPAFATLTAAEFKQVADALAAPDAKLRKPIYDLLPALGKSLVDIIIKGNESYYLATLRYQWTTHSYTIPNSTRGGYVEALSGPLASYFTGTIVWLREADDLQYANGIWKRTRSWLGADQWNATLYP